MARLGRLAGAGLGFARGCVRVAGYATLAACAVPCTAAVGTLCAAVVAVPVAEAGAQVACGVGLVVLRRVRSKARSCTSIVVGTAALATLFGGAAACVVAHDGARAACGVGRAVFRCVGRKVLDCASAVLRRAGFAESIEQMEEAELAKELAAKLAAILAPGSDDEEWRIPAGRDEAACNDEASSSGSSASWNGVCLSPPSGTTPPQLAQLRMLFDCGILWKGAPGGRRRFRILGAGQVAPDGSCGFASFGVAAGEGETAAQVRARGVSAGAEAVSNGRLVPSAAQHLQSQYRPGLHNASFARDGALFRVPFVLEKERAELVQFYIDELLSGGYMTAEEAVLFAYSELGTEMTTMEAWCKFMSLAGTPDETHCVSNLYFEPPPGDEAGPAALVGHERNPAGCGVWCDEIALRALAAAYGRAVFVVHTHPEIGPIVYTYFPLDTAVAVSRDPIILLLLNKEGDPCGGDHFDALFWAEMELPRADGDAAVVLP